MDRRGRRALLVGVTLAMLAAGCSGSAPDHVAKIGVVAPLDAGLVKFGRGIRNSVELAVSEANARHTVPGWRFEVADANDSSDPATGEASARRLADDPAVIGVVGTYNSGVAARVAPVLDKQGIVMISPGNTDPTLTLGADLAKPARPWSTYFRMVTADNVQGPFLATYAFDKAKARRVAVVSETKPVSKGLADAFRAAYEAKGGTVVLDRVVPDGTTDYGTVMKEIGLLKPDLLFFGGEYDVGAQFSNAAGAAGITVPVMGGDGLKDDAYVSAVGAAGDGDLASTVGAPLASLQSAQPFVGAYARIGYPDPPSDFGVYAYDAANVIIAASTRSLTRAAKVTHQTRTGITDAVQRTDTAGASGRVAFDEFGDTRTKVLTLYRVADRAWKAIDTETVS